MSYSFYKILHLTAVFFVFFSLGGLTLRFLLDPQAAKSRRVGLTHGIGLVVVLVSGFGLLARLGVKHDWLFPPWIWGKIGLWLALGAAIAIVRRKPQWNGLLWFALPLLGGLAAYLALMKPGG